MKPPSKKTITGFCAMALLALPACESGIVNTMEGIGDDISTTILGQRDLNMTPQNYAAADYLISQANTFINRRYDLIIIEPLNDVNQPGMTSQISKMIPEEIGIRLSQLGYRIDLGNVATAADTNYLRPAISKGEKPDYVLSGTYHRKRNEMDVSLRIVDIGEQRVLASYDYILPLTNDMEDLAKPQPKIVRVTGQ